MKFGKRLAAQIVADWADHYVAYKKLKKLIKTEPTAFDAFVAYLASELSKVNDFYEAKSKEFLTILDELTKDTSGNVQTEEHKTRFREFCAQLNRFRAFIILNYMAVIKIVKKWNKREDEHKASLDPFAILHSSPFYHSRSLGQLVVKAEMLALCFNPEGPGADRKNFTCPVCWDVLRNPVVLGCAHRFCWSCITQALETSDCCPVCRKRQLLEDGDLEVDVWLAEFVEHHVPSATTPAEAATSTQATVSPQPWWEPAAKKRVTVSLPTKSKKALMICVSGFRMDVLSFGSLTNIQSSITTGKYSLATKVGLPCSGSCWATTLTGFREQRHGISGDKFCKKQMRTPTFLRALKLKGLTTAAVSAWRPFNTLVEGDADLCINYPCDDKVTANACQLLADPSCPDAIVVHLLAPDTVGKEVGFSPTCKQYVEALEQTDARIGKLLSQVRQRQDEDWMVIITTDYSRVPKVVATGSEPGNTFLVLVNQAIEPGEISPGPRNIDIAATLMRFFELYRECGRLDGRPIALNAEEEAADALQREVLEAKAAAAHDAHGPLKPAHGAPAPTLSHLETVVIEMENLRMHVNCLSGLLNIPRVQHPYQQFSTSEEFLHELMGKITASAHRIIERVGCIQYEMHVTRSMGPLGGPPPDPGPPPHPFALVPALTLDPAPYAPPLAPSGPPPPPPPPPSYEVALTQPASFGPPGYPCLPGPPYPSGPGGPYLCPPGAPQDAGPAAPPAPPGSEPTSPTNRYAHNPYHPPSSDLSYNSGFEASSHHSPPSESSDPYEEEATLGPDSATPTTDSFPSTDGSGSGGSSSRRRSMLGEEGAMLVSLLGGFGQVPTNTLLARVSSRAVPSVALSARRLSILTFNTWRTEPYDAPKCPAGQPFAKRATALQAFFQQHQHVDIFALQEADLAIMAGLQRWLPYHTPAGNGQELCILWNASRFRMLDFGVEMVGQSDPQPIIWVRLEWSTGSAFATVLVVNVHFSWQGNGYEVQTARNPRMEQAADVVERIAALAYPTEPVVVCGDFNDAYHAPRVFTAAGYRDCFGERNRAAPPTWPTEGACIAHHRGSQTLDWIFVRNGINAQRVQVVDFHHDGVTPSDHLAVYAEYSVPNHSRRSSGQPRGSRRAVAPPPALATLAPPPPPPPLTNGEVVGGLARSGSGSGSKRGRRTPPQLPNGPPPPSCVAVADPS